MPQATPFFDLLDDKLVQEVVCQIPPLNLCTPANPDWGRLAETCRRLCRLVRRTRIVNVNSHAEGVLTVVRSPPQRAFTHVRRLWVKYRASKGVEEWGLVADAAAAAVTAWPQLEDVTLYGGWAYDMPPGEPGCMSAALLALRHAPALRQLTLELPDAFSLVYVTALTQLTRLELDSYDHSIVLPLNHNSRPLAAMPNLVELKLLITDVSERLPCALPPNLTRLDMKSCWGGEGDWWAHVAGCRQLRKLHLEGEMNSVSANPTLLLQAVAEQLTALTLLDIQREHVQEEGGEERLTAVVQKMLQAAGYDIMLMEESYMDWVPQVPLLGHFNDADLDAYVMVPPRNMAPLPSLQQLNLQNWWLVVTSGTYWEALAGCSSLRSLSELHVDVPPPAGVSFPHLTWLDITCKTTPGETVTLLGAFPALRELELVFVPYEEDEEEDLLPVAPPAGLTAGLPQLATAAITLMYPLDMDFNRLPAIDAAQCLAGYCSALWGALPGLRRLQLEIPGGLQQLPRVFGLEQLTTMWLRVMPAQQTTVGVQQVVQVVQGAMQLQELYVRLEPAPGSSKDQLVLELQEALPQLTQLEVLGGERGLAQGTLAALRPGLNVDC